MNETVQLVKTLKKLLKLKGVSYREVGTILGLSEPSVKRMFSQYSFTLQRLEQVCQHLEISLMELAKMGLSQDAEEQRVLTLEQEKALAADAMLMNCFYLLLGGWRVSKVKAEYTLSDVEMTSYLTRLDRLKLIELLPGNRVRVLTARHIRWRPDGPVMALYTPQVHERFLKESYEGEEYYLEFETARLSNASMQIIQRKLAHVLRELRDLSEMEVSLDEVEKKQFGILIGFRPWLWEVVSLDKSRTS